ncbi:hypothetical protein [Streptomyces gossypii]|uniref:hypothetical protein n=1 Tax=Streptomyces gossypii TaxID=2883101 RepID=UPI0035CD0AD7
MATADGELLLASEGQGEQGLRTPGRRRSAGQLISSVGHQLLRPAVVEVVTDDMPFLVDSVTNRACCRTSPHARARSSTRLRTCC